MDFKEKKKCKSLCLIPQATQQLIEYSLIVWKLKQKLQADCLFPLMIHLRLKICSI